jgi:hypothetical protein
MKRAYDCHLTDLSEPMLECSRRLNPECAHAAGDMRTLDLGRTFDLVLAHDAIDYMLSEDDGRGVRLFEWAEPAVPGRSTVDVHYTFLVRDPGGDVRNVYERHTTGLFSGATSERLLAERGFSVEVAVERTEEDRAVRLLFLARKPGSGAP